MFSEFAIGEHLLLQIAVCAPEITVIKIYYSFIWPFVFLFICFRSRLHQIMQAKFMPPKNNLLTI